MQVFTISERIFDTPEFVFMCVCVSRAYLFQLVVYVGVLLKQL